MSNLLPSGTTMATRLVSETTSGIVSREPSTSIYNFISFTSQPCVIERKKDLYKKCYIMTNIMNFLQVSKSPEIAAIEKDASTTAPTERLTDETSPGTETTSGLPESSSPMTTSANRLPGATSTVTEPAPGMSLSTGSLSTGTEDQASPKAGSAIAVIAAVVPTGLLLLIAGLTILCYIQR